MKKISLLNSDKYALIDNQDYQEVSHHNWYYHPRGYAICYQRTIRSEDSQRKSVFLHNFILCPPQGFQADHINRDGLDCRRSNLRVATASQNHGNKPKPRGTHTSQYKGVSWSKVYKRWFVSIQCQGRQYYIGRFKSQIEAAHAYDARAIELFGEFALTNFKNARKNKLSDG